MKRDSTSGKTTTEIITADKSVEYRCAIEQLMRIHYGVFMANPRFWYERDLRDADRLIVVAASDLRREINAVGGS